MYKKEQMLSFRGTEGVEDSNDEGNSLINDSNSKIPLPNSEASALIGNSTRAPMTMVSSQSAIASFDNVADAKEHFEVGNHVYTRASSKNLLVQRHGIVVHVDDDGDTFLMVDFSVTRATSTTSFKIQNVVYPFTFRREHPRTTKWHKFIYGISKWEKTVNPPGTCSCDHQDPPELILERFNFWMLNFNECQQMLLTKIDGTIDPSPWISYWCSTGKCWYPRPDLILGSCGMVASSAAAGSIAVAAESSACCLLVAVEVAAPIVLPVIAIGSLAIGGVAAWKAHQIWQEWKRITQEWNRLFQRRANVSEELVIEHFVDDLDGEVDLLDVFTT